MSKKSKFIKMSMLWEDYEITVTPGPRSGFDVVFMDIDKEYESDPVEVKRRHCAYHETAINVMVTWGRQVEEGRVRK